MKKNAKIFISTSTFGKYDSSYIKMMEDKRLTVILNPYGRKLTIDEQINLYKDIDGLIAGTEILNQSVLESVSNLKVISRCGVGIDNVDLEAAKKFDIDVYNTPDAPTQAVAELTIALIIDLLRNVTKMDTALKAGKWNKLMGNLIHNKKIGIIGFGRIGQKVAELISAFGVEISYFDLEKKKTKLKCDYKTLEEILSWSDIITLHLPPCRKGKIIIGDKELKLMKNGSWLINVSRGGVVDEKALYKYLKNGHLNGCAKDVFAQEPYSGELRELDNVILTPHIGSYAKESRIIMELEAVDNLINGLNKRGVI